MQLQKAVVELKAAQQKLFALDKQAESGGCKAEEWQKAKRDLERSVERIGRVLA